MYEKFICKAISVATTEQIEKSKTRRHPEGIPAAGQWVVGEYHSNLKQPHIHLETRMKRRCPVNPNTVRAFTGMVDSFGKRIFLEDLVDVTSCAGHLGKYRVCQSPNYGKIILVCYEGNRGCITLDMSNIVDYCQIKVVE